MSLLTDFSEKCIMIDKTTTSDGDGGFITTWVDGAKFDAAIALDTSIATAIANSAAARNTYTVLTAKGSPLPFHALFRRMSDGKVFRVVKDGSDSLTPDSANLSLSKVTAEEYTLPND